MSKTTLNKIFETLNNKARKKRASCTERNNWEGYNSAYERLENEAKQAILRWVADEVIGTKRDQEYRLIDTNWASTRREKVYLSDGISRNKLRNEQRKILAQHGWKGGQR